MAVLAKKYGIAPSLICKWKEALLQNSSKAFDSETSDKQEVKRLKSQNERLIRKVGQLTLECDFFPTKDVKEHRRGIDKWIQYYNYQRPHQGIEGQIPSNVYKMTA